MKLTSSMCYTLKKVAELLKKSRGNMKNDIARPYYPFRAKKALKEIIKDLNKILLIVNPNNGKLAKWIEDLQNILPPRR